MKNNPLVVLSRTKYIYGIMIGIFSILFLYFRIFALENRYARSVDQTVTICLAAAFFIMSAVLLTSSYFDYKREFLRLERILLEMNPHETVTPTSFAEYADIPREEAEIFLSKLKERNASGKQYAWMGDIKVDGPNS